MLSRSGLTIRKLIPHRRSSDEDLSNAELEDALLVSWTEQDGGGGGAGGKIYAASRSYNRRKQPPAPIIATSPLTHSDILRPLPPLPSETPRSSASSLCRCERHVECDCPLLSWKRRSPLYSIPSKGDSEDTLLLSCINTVGPDETITHHIPKSRFYLSNNSKSKGDLPQALSPEERHDEVRTNERKPEEPLPQALSDDVQQFMQETEDAFKAIGSTLSKVPEPTPPTPPPKETPPKSPQAKAPSTFNSSPNTPPKDNNPPPKPKMKKSKTAKQTRAIRPRKPTAPKQAPRTGPRWTLTENVSELLTGKLFHRIEADEILTPDQIEAYRQKRITKLQVDKMAEALENEVAEMSMEPFDLDLGIEAARVKADMETTAEEKSATSFSDVVQRKYKSNPSPLPLAPRPLFHKNKTFPVGSARHARSSSRKLVTELPIIPETSDDLYLNNESNESLTHSISSEYVYLKSSTYSLTTPTIQHGAIRLSKSDLLPDMKLGGDEGLDWTAFQMAILGGAGDLFTESDDTIRQAEAEEIADITEWWDSWNFESTGKLVTNDYEASSPTSTLSGDEIPDLSYSEIESNNPYSPHRTWQEAQRKSHASGLYLDLDFTHEKRHASSHYLSDGRPVSANGNWHQDGEQTEIIVNRESVNSLPPSPMLDLRVIRSSNGDDLDVVPMGYNLGHDLGDFLKWEAEHAYAGDFSSPTRLM
ncbi:hypothetical protein F4825DRAFT_455738 [Nemania diffusa]|nr:hypothetical protein F4825DRAFT_455738 [Nemania diffusa]